LSGRWRRPSGTRACRRNNGGSRRLKRRRARPQPSANRSHVLDAVGDGVFLVDRDGLIRLWNRGAALITGLPPEEVCGNPVEHAFPGWTGLADQIPIGEHAAAPRAATVPVSTGTRDMWLSFVAVRSAEGVVYAFRDQTRERRLEEEKSDLIATISHELRTPIAAVYGSAQTLLSRDAELPSEQRRQMLEMVATQATRLAEITEAVLLATQLDRGTPAVESEPVDVGELARATVEAMRLHLPPTAEVDVEVAPGVGPAAGATDRIQQVLVNLLDNAIKYGGDGPISVRVEPSNGTIRILVADSGPGIPLPEQQRIFEKFYRSGPELTRRSGGTGLGLYISRELVERMGGRIDVHSHPGAGATFAVELPRT
jgi:two-component system, OmpR family, phosphate regulon sensor histidine kinase PhoR